MAVGAPGAKPEGWQLRAVAQAGLWAVASPGSWLKPEQGQSSQAVRASTPHTQGAPAATVTGTLPIR